MNMNENTGKIIALRGLPASGKSTWAKAQVEKNLSMYRINKDDLRAMLKGNYWDRNLEKHVVYMRDMLIKELIVSGYTVIVDDTNFNDAHIRRFIQIARDYGTTVEIKDFDVPLEVCLERNKNRPNAVPEKVILDMYHKYVEGRPKPITQDPKNNKAIVVDLDGTLALHVNRGPFEFSKCYSDEVNKPVLACVKGMLAAGYQIIFVSGREDFCREETKRWLQDKCGFSAEHIAGYLHMRKTGDHRKDATIKEEIYRDIVQKYYIDFVLDDRNQVVDHMRELGFQVFQVAPGDF